MVNEDIKLPLWSYALIAALAVAGIVYLLWELAGTRLPPASLIDADQMSSGKRKIREEKPAHGTFLVASDTAYPSWSFALDTVSARALILVAPMAVLELWALHWALSEPQLGYLEAMVLSRPPLWTAIGVVSLLFAVAGGFVRHLYNNLKDSADAILVLDETGAPTFAYVGDRPPRSWLYSPWPRALSWIAVSLPSLLGAAALSLASVDYLVSVGPFGVALGILVIRYAASAILANASRQGGA